MSLPWWLWLILGFVLLAAFLGACRRFYRRGVRERFVQFLEETHPEIEVLKADEAALQLRSPDVDGHTLFLGNLYSNASRTRMGSDEERTLFEEFLAAATELHDELQEPLSLEKHGDRLMPRLLRPRDLTQLTAHGEVPHAPLESLGLEIVYVLDAPHSVRYLTNTDLGDLGIGREELHERALANLEKVFPRDAVRDAIGQGAVAMVKAGDRYDAARLLLVPRYLQPGEEVVALIPDRDTLTLTPLPRDGDWRPLRKLARTPDSDKLLLDCPVRVTANGFERV